MSRADGDGGNKIGGWGVASREFDFGFVVCFRVVRDVRAGEAKLREIKFIIVIVIAIIIVIIAIAIIIIAVIIIRITIIYHQHHQNDHH